MAIEPGVAVDIASGILLVALGLFVASVKPRQRTSLVFAAFSVAYGVLFGMSNLGRTLPAESLLRTAASVAAGVGFIVATAALVVLATSFPRPLERRRWKILVAPAFVGGALALLIDPFYGALIMLLYVLAIRHGALRPTERAAGVGEEIRFASVGLALWPGYVAGLFLAQMGRGSDTAAALAAVVALAGLVALWLRNVSTAKRPGAARTVAWVILATPLAAGLVLLLAPSWASHGGPARILGVLILAYAILRHQLLGLDVKVRIAISKSTIAAVFIAVFFIASEAAQQFFGEALGSQYVGILAAGALVFAIAPLSRLADRLAEKAVPVVTPTLPGEQRASGVDDASQEAIFRNALRLALRDRRITRAEEAHLHELAEALRIRPRRAHEMLSEVEREVGREVD